MAQGVAPVYFTDENTLGLGKLLQRRGREDIRYPGTRNCRRSHAAPTIRISSR